MNVNGMANGTESGKGVHFEALSAVEKKREKSETKKARGCGRPVSRGRAKKSKKVKEGRLEGEREKKLPFFNLFSM